MGTVFPFHKQAATRHTWPDSHDTDDFCAWEGEVVRGHSFAHVTASSRSDSGTHDDSFSHFQADGSERSLRTHGETPVELKNMDIWPGSVGGGVLITTEVHVRN